MGCQSPITVALGGCGSSWGSSNSTLSMELHPFYDPASSSASASVAASACDPDTAFSYLDEKLRAVLGDVQKEFEGGVSADKLGSKYGGYGSFLPTYERCTPLVYLSQPKAPVTPTNDAVIGKVSPNEGLVGRMRRNEAVAVSSSLLKSEKLCGRVGASMDFDTNKSNSHLDNSEAMEDDLSTGRPNFTTKKPLLVDHDQKRVTLRIKMGGNSDARRKNSSIYNGFGLDNSSVSMEDDDSDGDKNSHSELESSSPERSPSSMIQRITSYRIPSGGTLLSPLQDYHLLELKERDRNAAFSLPIKAKQRKTTVKDIGHEKIDKLAEETEETLGEVKLGNAGWTESLKKSKKGDMDRSWKERKLKLSTKLSGKELASYADNSSEISQSNEKASNPARVPIKEMASPGRFINYELNEGKKLDSNKDVLEPSKLQKIQNQETIKGSSSKYVGHNGKRVKEVKEEEKEGKKLFDVKGSTGVHIERKVDAGVKIKVKASSSDYSGTEKALEPELSWGETRKNLKDSEKEAKRPKDLTKTKGKERKDIIAKNPLTKDRKSDTLREGGKETFRAFCKNETKAEVVESLRKESKGKDVSYKGNPRLFDTERDGGIQIASEPVFKAATTATGVLITEDWVECDKCKTWRLLPLGIKPEELPKKWRCKMLTWLQGMNSCKYTEEQTTQAVYALYSSFPPPPPPPSLPALSVGVPSELPNCSKSESLNHRSEREIEKSGMSKKTCKILLGSSAKSQTPTEEGKLTSVEDDLGYLRVMEDKRKAKEKEKLKRMRTSEGDILQVPKKRLKAPSPQISLDAAERDVTSDQSGSFKRLKITHNLHERTNHDRMLEDSMRDTGKSLCSDVGRNDRAVHDAKVRESDAAAKCAPSKMNSKNGGLQESNDDRAVLSFDYAEGCNRQVNGKPRETNALFSDRLKDRDGRDGRYDRQYSLEKASREPDEEKKLNPDVDQLKRKDKRDGFLKVLSHDKQEGGSPTIRDGGHDQRQQTLSGVKKRKSEAVNKGRKTVVETSVDPQSRQELAVNRQPQISSSIAQAHNSNQREDRGERLNSTKKNSEKSQNVSQSIDPNLRATVDYELCKPTKGQADCAMAAIKSSGVSNSHIGRDDTARIQSAANLVIQEARDLKHCADRLKANGGTDMYFRACLKYLHAASMLEPINAESAKLGETTQSINVYAETAKLCEFCASSYERTKELAAAALAYKCAGLAHMRVVMAKKTCATKDRSELVAAYHQLPPGESPSSSSLDVDNLCHQEKLPSSAATKGGVASPVLPGNYIIAARNRSSYNRVLQYVSDVTSALEAFEKSQNAYAMVDRSSTSAEGVQALKNVVDSSVDDVENLLRFVRLALEAIQE